MNGRKDRPYGEKFVLIRNGHYSRRKMPDLADCSLNSQQYCFTFAFYPNATCKAEKAIPPSSP